MKRLIFELFIWTICLGIAFATLSATDKKGKKKKEKKIDTEEEIEFAGVDESELENEPKALEESLEDLQLLQTVPRRGQLVEYYGMQNGYASEDIKKNFAKPTLGFVTPWNNYGYDFAKEFAKKFDMISPVWIQIRASIKDEACFMTGTHDVDKGWMNSLRQRNPDLRIVPRFMFDGWSAEHFELFFSSEIFMHNCVRAIRSTCQQFNFDGVVIELWLQAGKEFKSDIVHFMGDLKIAMNTENRLAILVLPPAIRELSAQVQTITRKDFAEIAPVVDYVALMTYDFWYPQGKPGPTAPLPWVRGNIEVLCTDGDENRAKILTGLNFYGYDFTPGQYPQPKLARDLVEILKKHKSKAEVKWDSFGHENNVDYEEGGRKHMLYYPTLRSIRDKIEVAQQMNTGLMIWELGQGARIFNELL